MNIIRIVRNFLPLLLFVIIGGFNPAKSQIQEGNLMVGGSVTSMNFGLKSGQAWDIGLTPKAGYFFRDNFVAGLYVDLNISKQGEGSSTRTAYGVGAFARYYASPRDMDNLLRSGRFFFEANAGIEGANQKGEPTTNGFGFGLGPGYSYFITPNVGIEALVKYNGLTGGGNTDYQHAISFGIGLQIYLPTARVRNAVNNPSQL